MIATRTPARREVPQLVDLWNEAIVAQGEGYERHVPSAERLERIMDDANFLPESVLTARRAGRLVGSALGCVQTVDSLGTGKFGADPEEAGVGLILDVGSPGR